jgi:hypothetical protein
MGKPVRVAVAEQTKIGWNFNTAKNQLSAFDQTVDIC